MYGIQWVDTFPSGNILTFVRSCHEYPEICMNMSQIPSKYVQVCQFTPNYIREKYACTTYNIFPVCAVLHVSGVIW